MKLCLCLAAAYSLAWAGPPEPSELAAKAKLYLETASGMIAAAPPDFQAGALMQLGVVTSAHDPKKALEYYEQAFAASAVLPTQSGYRLREEFQATLAGHVAKVDVERAIELIVAMTPPPAGDVDSRSGALNEITRQLLAKKKLDRATEFLDRMVVGGAYPFDAITLVIKAQPPGDEHRQLLFSQALVGFQQRPQTEPFERFIRTFRKEMPEQTFQQAVRLLGKTVLDGKGLPEPHSQTMVAPSGTVTLTDPKDVEIFNALDLIADVDPAWAKEIARRPGLQAVLERYPRGKASIEVGQGETVTTRGTIRPGQSKAEIEQRAQVLAFETQKMTEAMRYINKDPVKTLEAAAQLPSPQLQARVIEMVAMMAGSKDPAEARSLLGKCVETLEAIKSPDWRANGWGAVAVSAAKIQDTDLALKALEKGVGDARAVYKQEANPDDPNPYTKAVWTSTQLFKLLFHRAARSLGLAAEPLLEKVPDPEIQIIARVEMAAAWSGTPSTGWFAPSSRPKKK